MEYIHLTGDAAWVLALDGAFFQLTLTAANGLSVVNLGMCICS